MTARFLQVGLVGWLLAGCQYGLPMVDSPDDVYPGEVILVGKVILDPPLQEGEQNVSMSMGSQINLINLFTSDQEVMIDPNNVRYGHFQKAIKATLGEQFCTIAPFDKGNISGATLFLDDMEKIYFPGGLQFTVEAEDQAVYLGTIRYRRNDFYEITDLDVLDEYSEAEKEFASKFGDGVTLRKALLKPVKAQEGTE